MVADMVINNEEFTTRIAKVTLAKMIQRDVSFLVVVRLIVTSNISDANEKSGEIRTCCRRKGVSSF